MTENAVVQGVHVSPIVLNVLLTAVLGLQCLDPSRRVSGLSVDDIVKGYAQMSSGVAKFALDHEAAFGRITPAQLRHIRELEETGDKQGAMLALSKDMADFFGGTLATKTDLLTATLKSLAGGFDLVGSAIRKATGGATDVERLYSLQQRLAQFKVTQPNARDPALELQIAALQRKIEQDNRSAAAEATHATASAAAAADLFR